MGEPQKYHTLANKNGLFRSVEMKPGECYPIRHALFVGLSENNKPSLIFEESGEHKVWVEVCGAVKSNTLMFGVSAPGWGNKKALKEWRQLAFSSSTGESWSMDQKDAALDIINKHPSSIYASYLRVFLIATQYSSIPVFDGYNCPADERLSLLKAAVADKNAYALRDVAMIELAGIYQSCCETGKAAELCRVIMARTTSGQVYDRAAALLSRIKGGTTISFLPKTKFDKAIEYDRENMRSMTEEIKKSMQSDRK